MRLRRDLLEAPLLAARGQARADAAVARHTHAHVTAHELEGRLRPDAAPLREHLAGLPVVEGEGEREALQGRRRRAAVDQMVAATRLGAQEVQLQPEAWLGLGSGLGLGLGLGGQGWG